MEIITLAIKYFQYHIEILIDDSSFISFWIYWTLSKNTAIYIYIYIFMTRHRKYFNIRDYVLSIILSIYQNIKCKMKNIWNIFMIYHAVFFTIYVIYMLIYSIYYIIRITYYIHIFIKLICKQSVCRNSHSLYKKI